MNTQTIPKVETVELKTVEVKPFPSTFKKKGFIHTLVKREGMKAIYERRWVHGETSHYEVVKLGKHNGYNMGGSYIEPSETYPGSSLWGIMGWTCTDLDSANKRYELLT